MTFFYKATSDLNGIMKAVLKEVMAQGVREASFHWQEVSDGSSKSDIKAVC